MAKQGWQYPVNMFSAERVRVAATPTRRITQFVKAAASRAARSLRILLRRSFWVSSRGSTVSSKGDARCEPKTCLKMIGPAVQQSLRNLTRIITYTSNHERVEVTQALPGYSSKSPTTSLKNSCRPKAPSSATQASMVLRRNNAYT